MAYLRKFTTTLTVLAALGIGVAAGPTAADEYPIPQGHTYGPGHERLPPLNSWQDRVQAQADLREAEIQRLQRENRIFYEDMRLFFEHDLIRPGRGYSAFGATRY